MTKFQADLKTIFDAASKLPSWENPLGHHIYFKFIEPSLPKFWYFDDYYSLPGKIRIQDLTENPTSEKLKTARALFELARISPKEIIDSTNYEKFVAQLDKVATFISLLRGQKLNLACLLDTFTDAKGRARVEDLIKYKIIKEKHIRFFDEFAHNGKKTADIEDLFDKDEYLQLFNQAFSGEHNAVVLSSLDGKLETVIKQINAALGIDRFNHFRPANKFSSIVNSMKLSDGTLDRFEKMFAEINKLF